MSVAKMEGRCKEILNITYDSNTQQIVIINVLVLFSCFLFCIYVCVYHTLMDKCT